MSAVSTTTTVTCPSCLLALALSGPMCGVLILGLGDALASIVGVQYGRTRWPGLAHKSIEGSAAALAVCLVFPLILALLLPCTALASAASTTAPTAHSLSLLACSWGQVGGFTLATATTVVLEAYTTQIDNLFLPIYYWAALACWT
eukprot:TRINITY_DN2572_c1_g1_i1.p1 TRINITY_DN2572_c1_g1~~TRINITY_DN2572_c1_g1_i1.p1  ORF type:complete len:146 (+),score=2.82 TRINITY_DN2572_c1_g1_i1:23-460(+)